MTELNFWAAQCINLESLFEQMQSNTTIKMASILFLTDSAYYPAFKSMYRNVVAAMKEAQDITTHLKPLTSHFEVLCQLYVCLQYKSMFVRIWRSRSLLTSGHSSRR